ncbi:hypothetical protein E2C01_008805 [Portunus trituberculatus]|uniref:Uncharacterized protein n=1 Tax=Portunus trituberculatus TaxID=210409 RepID=A0A5B7D1S5_PORTR|nr:hypothetical protein [Portunus trituberculatus]
MSTTDKSVANAEEQVTKGTKRAAEPILVFGVSVRLRGGGRAWAQVLLRGRGWVARCPAPGRAGGAVCGVSRRHCRDKGNSPVCRRCWRKGFWFLERGRGVGTAAAAAAPWDQNTSRAADGGCVGSGGEATPGALVWQGREEETEDAKKLKGEENGEEELEEEEDLEDEEDLGDAEEELDEEAEEEEEGEGEEGEGEEDEEEEDAEDA